jgi:hypothetical protein
MESMTAANRSAVANVIDRIYRAVADGRAAVDLPFINPAVVNLETPTAMAA